MGRRRRGGLRPGSDLLRRWRSSPTTTTRGVPAALEDAWRTVVGPAVAASSRPIGLNARGVLTVAVADAIWSQEITARADELIAALTATVAGAEIRQLRTRVADHVFPDTPEQAARTPLPPPGEDARRAARQVARDISDPEVRAAVERAAAAALSQRNKNG